MLIFQLLRFSNANIGNLESSLFINQAQVIPQGLWDSHVMKLNRNMFAQFENLHYTLCLTVKSSLHADVSYCLFQEIGDVCAQAMRKAKRI